MNASRIAPEMLLKQRRGGGFNLQPRDAQAEKILAEGKNNPRIPGGLPARCLKAMFESSRTFGLFTEYFDKELYDYATSYYDNNVFGRQRPMHAILGITRVLEDVEISQRNHSPHNDLKRFLEQDFSVISNSTNNAGNVIRKFSNYLTARIDIKLMSTEGNFEVLSISDDSAKIEKPAWFNKTGIGYVITSYAGELEFTVKATAAGIVNFSLKGVDVREPNDKTKRIPYWIDYTKLTINDDVIFDKLTPAWHNKPYSHNFNVKAGEEIKIKVEWQPHRSDT